MADIKKFNSYNFVTGAVDGTLAYDFTNPGLYREEETYELPKKRPARRARMEEQQWIKEDTRSETREKVARQLGVSPFSLLGSLCVIVLLTMMLLAQIQLTDISQTAAALEDQIIALELEQNKLTAEYETIFNLKAVEAYATTELGMQLPSDDQIYYLTGVAAADKAVVVTQDGTDMFSLGLKDLLSSVKAYFS